VGSIYALAVFAGHGISSRSLASGQATAAAPKKLRPRCIGLIVLNEASRGRKPGAFGLLSDEMPEILL